MKFTRYAYPALGVALIFALWASITGAGFVGEDILPSPWRVVEAMITKHDRIFPELLATSHAVLLSIGFISVFSLIAGLIIVDVRAAGMVLYPLLVGSQVIPKVALGPVVLIFMGFGAASKVTIAALIAFFPPVMGTVLGLLSVSNEKRALAKTMGASWWRELVKIRIPAALPNYLSSLKIGAIYCVSGVIIAEFIGSDNGIGRLVLQASTVFDIETVFAATGFIILLGLAVYGAMNAVEATILWLLRGPCTPTVRFYK